MIGIDYHSQDFDLLFLLLRLSRAPSTGCPTQIIWTNFMDQKKFASSGKKFTLLIGSLQVSLQLIYNAGCMQGAEEAFGPGGRKDLSCTGGEVERGRHKEGEHCEALNLRYA